MNAGDIGSQAENLAGRHLARLGYRIVARNYRVKAGEIDLVAEDGPVLCFVEVRARKDARHGAPAETVTPAKQRRIVRAARAYLARRRAAPAACRFDVVSVQPEGVTVIRDAFRSPEW